MMKYPNLFVVGAPKCGTSTLYEVFRNHPQIGVSINKELHYFAREHLESVYYHFPIIKNIEDYLSQFEKVKNSCVVADISPSYLYQDIARDRIWEHNHNSKIIIMLRDPVKRAISHYMMDVAKGYQNRSLIEVLKLGENTPWWYQYMELGNYSKYIKGYYDRFGKDNVLVVFMEELIDSTENVYKKIFDFLDVDEDYTYVNIKTNEAFIPRIPFVSKLRATKIVYFLYRKSPATIKNIIKKLLTVKGKGKYPDEGKEELKSYYKDEIVECSQMFERDLRELWTSFSNGEQ